MAGAMLGFFYTKRQPHSTHTTAQRSAAKPRVNQSAIPPPEPNVKIFVPTPACHLLDCLGQLIAERGQARAKNCQQRGRKALFARPRLPLIICFGVMALKKAASSARFAVLHKKPAHLERQLTFAARIQILRRQINCHRLNRWRESGQFPANNNTRSEHKPPHRAVGHSSPAKRAN